MGYIREALSTGTIRPASSDNLEVYFSAARFGLATAGPILNVRPQAALLPRGQFLTDTLHYTYLSTTFVAQGGEQFFTLGNFQPDSVTTLRRFRADATYATYALDDVAVEAVPPAGVALALPPVQWLGPCGGAATLTAGAGFQGYRWRTGQTTASITVAQPGRYVVTGDFGCGTVTDSTEVRRYDAARQRLLPPLTAAPCPGTAVTYAALPGMRDYQWADGPAGPTRTLTQPGRYHLTARTLDGCLVRDSLDFAYLPTPARPPGLPPDTLACAGQPWQLRLPPPPAGTSYEWSTGDYGPVLRLPTAAPGTYTLTVRTRCATATAAVRVQNQDCAALTIPNIVTPNGDGLNDRFQVRGPGPRTLRLEVYDRWGRRVFASPDYRGEWPGAPRPATGLYYYLLTDETYGTRHKGWIEVAY